MHCDDANVERLPRGAAGLRAWSIFVILGVGCSGEPSAPPGSPNNAPAAPVAVAPIEPTPWSVETLAEGEFTVEEGFRPLTLSDFESFVGKPLKEPTTTWVASHDAIVCFGKPRGYLYSRETFGDFTLRLELRFAPPADRAGAETFNPNTGVMLFIQEPHKLWPKSLEVQGRWADLASIKANGGAAAIQVHDDDAARQSARKPIGEWNALEIVAKAGAVTAFLNGTKICESQPSDVTSGSIGLQSEDFEVHFRRLRIRPAQ